MNPSKRYQTTLDKLLSGPVERSWLIQKLCSIEGFFSDRESEIEYLKACGLPLSETEEGKVSLDTAHTTFREQVFCIVDIETSGSKPNNSQIIEIGALKWKNGQVLDHYESLIHCDSIPDYITKITNIATRDVANAPRMEQVMQEFRLFLGNCVFVAHNVNFDYSFISHMLKKYDLGILLNRKLCTIDLARKTIEAERYGLDYITSHLDIHMPVRHRAYADALAASKVLEESFKNIPEEVVSVEDLIAFSRPKKAKKKIRREKPNAAPEAEAAME